MVQVIRSGPTEASLRQQAFQQGIDQFSRGLSGAYQTIKQAEQTERQRALQDQAMERQKAQDVLNMQQDFAERGVDVDPELAGEILEGRMPVAMGEIGQEQEVVSPFARLAEKAREREQQKRDQEVLARRMKREEFAQKKEERKLKQESERQKSIANMRKEINALPSTKETVALDAAIGKLDKSLAANSAAGDIAGVFSYMKILDPTSTVREGEYAKVASAAGAPDRLITLFAKVDRGEELSPRQRKEFRKAAIELAGAQMDTYRKATQAHREYIREQGLPEEQILPQFTIDKRIADHRARQQEMDRRIQAPQGLANISMPAYGEQGPIPYAPNPNMGDMLGIDANASTQQNQAILQPERVQFRQSRIQELRNKRGQ